MLESLDLDNKQVFIPNKDYMKQKFDYYNKLFFNNELPKTRLYYSKIKSYQCGIWCLIARCRNFNAYFSKLLEYRDSDELKKIYATEEIYDEYLKENFKKDIEAIYINNMLSLTEKQFNEILIHEMIHSYTYNNNLEKESPHDSSFIKKMNQINNKISKISINKDNLIEIDTICDIRRYAPKTENDLIKNYNLVVLSFIRKENLGTKEYKYICIKRKNINKALEIVKKYIENNEDIKKYEIIVYTFEKQGFYAYTEFDDTKPVLEDIESTDILKDILFNKTLKKEKDIKLNENLRKNNTYLKSFYENESKLSKENEKRILNKEDEIEILYGIENSLLSKMIPKESNVEITDIEKVKDKKSGKNVIDEIEITISVE